MSRWLLCTYDNKCDCEESLWQCTFCVSYPNFSPCFAFGPSGRFFWRFFFLEQLHTYVDSFEAFVDDWLLKRSNLFDLRRVFGCNGDLRVAINEFSSRSGQDACRWQIVTLG